MDGYVVLQQSFTCFWMYLFVTLSEFVFLKFYFFTIVKMVTMRINDQIARTKIFSYCDILKSLTRQEKGKKPEFV